MNYKVFLGVVALMGASVYGAGQPGGVVGTQAPAQSSSWLPSWLKKDAPAQAVQSTGSVSGNNVGAGVVDPKLQVLAPVASTVAPLPAVKASRTECMKWIRDHGVAVSGDYKAYLAALSANPSIAAALAAEATPETIDDVRIPPVCRYKSRTYKIVGKANAVSYAVHLVAKEDSKKFNAEVIKQVEASHAAAASKAPTSAPPAASGGAVPQQSMTPQSLAPAPGAVEAKASAMNQIKTQPAVQQQMPVAGGVGNGMTLPPASKAQPSGTMQQLPPKVAPAGGPPTN